MFKDLFISYGRRESLGFVARLHQKLQLAGYDGWFDKVNIPDGEDYAVRINHGIESAHNFVYVMAPRALSSAYCLIELEYARFLGKRVIPINQAVVFQVEDYPLSEADHSVLQQFYNQYGIADPQIKTTQQVLERSLALVGRTDWLDAKESLSPSDCEALANWAWAYENQWHKHESLEYLQNLVLPPFGAAIDSLDSVIERLCCVLERHKYYVSQHTFLSTQALLWINNQQLNHYLLVGKERQAAEEWLLVLFKNGEQAPCVPNELLCDFICESRKNAENRMTDCFICYDYADKAMRNKIVTALARFAITTWRHDHDIQHGCKAEQAILTGIAGADNLLYFISPNALTSEACHKEFTYAQQLNKRIIPLLIVETPNLPTALQNLQYINFTENTEHAQQHAIAEILRVLSLDNSYYKQHKILLNRALIWQAESHKSSFLLRGYNLENAKTWLRLNQQREQHPPTTFHLELINASEAAKDRLGTEVFLSYSRKDGDFARKLNRALQEAGKTVWFDQESISSGVDFEAELYKGIQNSDNFLFVISPDAINSPYCEQEVRYAMQQGKRILTVLYREIDAENLPEALRLIHWIDFATKAFDTQFPELIQTIELDREHAHQHTVLQQRACEWQENASSNDFLLNQSACEKAEVWFEAAKDKQPRVTALQEHYIHASRTAIESARHTEKQRRRVFLTSIFVGLIIATLAIFAWEKKQEAEQQKFKTEQQKQKAEENYTRAKLSNLAYISEKLMGRGDYTRALRVAQIAYATNPNPEKPIFKVEEALSDIYNDVVVNNKGSFYRQSFDGFDAEYSAKGDKMSVFFSTNVTQLWNLENGFAKLSETALKHDAPIVYGESSPDGNFMMTIQKDNVLKLWDAQGHWIRDIEHVTREGGGFSPDSQYLVSVSSTGELSLWNLRENKLVESQQGRGKVSTIKFLSKGKYILIVSKDNKAQLWSIHENKLKVIHNFIMPKNCDIQELLTTPTESKLLGIQYEGENNSKNLCTVVLKGDVASTILLAGHQYPVTQLIIAPDGKSFASGDDKGNIVFWNSAGHVKKTFPAHQGEISALKYSADSKMLLSGGSDKQVKSWSSEGELLHQYGGHEGIIHNVSFSPDGQFMFTGSTDRKIKLWSSNPPKLPVLNVKKAIKAARFIPPNEEQILIITNEDEVQRDEVQRWNHKNQTKLASYPLQEDRFLGITSDGKQIITYGKEDGQLRVRNIDNGAVIREWDSQYCTTQDKKQCSAPRSSNDAQFIIGVNEQNEVSIWKNTGELERRFPIPDNHSRVISISQNNRYFATYDDKNIKVWDFSGKLIYQKIYDDLISMDFLPDGTHIMDFSPDSTHIVLSGSLGEETEILSLLDKNEQSVKLHDRASVNNIQFSPTGKYLISFPIPMEGPYSTKDYAVSFWNQDSGHLSRTLEGHSKPVTDVQFSKEGDILTASRDGTVRIWPSIRKIYEWAKNNKDICQLTEEDRLELGIEEEKKTQ